MLKLCRQQGLRITGNISITPDQPPVADEGDSSVHSRGKLLNETSKGSTAMLFVNRSDNRGKRSSAQHQRGSSMSFMSLGAGYAAGAMLAAIDRSARRLPLPPLEAGGNVSFAVTTTGSSS